MRNKRKRSVVPETGSTTYSKQPNTKHVKDDHLFCYNSMHNNTRMLKTSENKPLTNFGRNSIQSW